MSNSYDNSHVPDDVRAAVRQFLTASQRTDDLFALTEAMDAVRHIFPGMNVSDRDLTDAIASEALMAGFEIAYDEKQRPKTLKRRSLEEWENEGGAVRSDPQRRTRKKPAG
jgi:hypothetical protein